MIPLKCGTGKARPTKVRTRVPFAALPHAIAGDPRLKPADKAVLLALLYFARGDASCWPSNESVAARAGCSTGTVKRSLRRLEDVGHVARQVVRPTLGNMTGRVVTLAWRVDDAYLGEGGAPGDRPAAHVDPAGGSTATPDGDRRRETVETPEGRGAEVRRRREAREAPRTPASAPVASRPPDAPTPGQLAFLASLSDSQRARLDLATPERRASLLAPFANGFDPIAARIVAAELPKDAPEARPAPTSTTEAIEHLPGSPPSAVADLAERLVRDMGGAKDRQLWGAFHRLSEQVWRGAVPVSVVLDSYRQATGPKSRNRGAVFRTAMGRHGWRP